MVGSPVYEMASILAQKAGCTVGAVYDRPHLEIEDLGGHRPPLQS